MPINYQLLIDTFSCGDSLISQEMKDMNKVLLLRCHATTVTICDEMEALETC
jgi:hypothetical protein